MSYTSGELFGDVEVRTFVVSFPPLKLVATIPEVGTLRESGAVLFSTIMGVFGHSSEACRAQSFSRPGMPVEAFSVFESRSSVNARRSCFVIDPSF